MGMTKRCIISLPSGPTFGIPIRVRSHIIDIQRSQNSQVRYNRDFWQTIFIFQKVDFGSMK